jgi:protein-disulfide isomerase
VSNEFVISTKQALIATFIFGLVLGAFVMGLFTGFGANKGVAGTIIAKDDSNRNLPSQDNEDSNEQPAKSFKINDIVDDDPKLGKDSAPIVMVEFSDYQCPFCARFFSNTLPELKKNYIETGKLQFVYRDFPLSRHPEAQPAAEAAECAGEQGKYFEMHDKIFANQASMSKESYKKWAEELSLDMQKFNNCLDSGKYKSEVQKDYSDGQRLGVRATPTYFIGKRGGDAIQIVGAHPYEVFQRAIDNLLQ